MLEKKIQCMVKNLQWQGKNYTRMAKLQEVLSRMNSQPDGR